MDIGRLCIKIAGRDAGKKCVIVDIMDGGFVLIDGETRRRKCNVKHLEPLKETVSVSKGADRAAVVAEFKKLGIELKDTKKKESKPRPKQIRAADRKKMAPKPAEKKATKKAATKKSEKTVSKEEKKAEKYEEKTDLEKVAENQ